ncbi:ATP-binding protein [Streptomyces angustmyceticus]|uniref:ATP-binding protein n=1 Tax=Streptomyces angustmyceticus TaxID=285578 RepID=UPI003D9470A3
MRIPVRHVAGNVVWTRHGTCWALWRVQGSGQPQTSRGAKEQRLRAIESLIKQLHGESMLLSLCPQIDPSSVVRRMTDDVDLANSERYAALALRVLDQLEGLELTSRADWLAVPLPAGGTGKAARMAMAAARAEMAQQLGLLPAPVSAVEEVRRLEQAREMAASWPSTVRLRPASEAEILWIYGHSARRGLVEPLLPEVEESSRVRGRGRGAAALGEVTLAEGALPASGEAGESSNPFTRRWLQVGSEWGESYQTFLTLQEMPERFVFPGSEYLARLDEFSFPVDWTVRLKVTPGSVAERQARRQARVLAHQPDEYDGEPAGTPDRVLEAADSIGDFSAALTRSKGEVEVQALATLCVWGTAPDQAEARAAEVNTYFSDTDYTFARPVGVQEQLFYGMLPGARTPQVRASYAQFLLARDFAMAAPFAGGALGDGRGPLFGLQLVGGGLRPVHTDWLLGPKKKASASAAFIGELGSGKSTAMKAAVYAILAAGRRLSQRSSRGRAVIVDRTPQQEWVKFARACPGTTQVITVSDKAQVSLDPLRMFGDAGEAQRRTESFLTLLLGVAPMEDAGVALSEAIEAVLAAPAPSMSALIAELQQRGKHDAISQALARKLLAAARKDLARMIFDPTLPVADTGQADALVFSVSGLALPKEHELSGDRLGKLEFEKLFGRAVLYLIAAVCRAVCFENPAEFCVAVWDECWWLTSSPEGEALLLELLRDGRKHNAAAFAGSHDADDIGRSNSELGRILQGLFRRRFVFRQSDVTLAKRALAFLGLDPDDEDLVERVTRGLSPIDVSDDVRTQRAGECLHGDLSGRIGAMQVLLPADPEAAAAIHSDPVLAA